jgi:CrcB protein
VRPVPDAPTLQRLVLPAIAVGGACGALARHALTTWLPQGPDEIGWTVVAVNVAGCLLLGVLAGRVETVPDVHPLLRPFLGVGVLGGFTTFSTFALDAHRLADAGAAGASLTYVGATVAGCLLASALGILLGSAAGRRR